MKKERNVLMGILGLVLVFGLVLSGCPTEAGETEVGLKPLTPGELPGLPEGSGAAWVSSAAEVETLLTALGDSYLPNNVQNSISNLVYNKSIPNATGYSYDFTDEVIASPALKVTGKGSGSQTGELDMDSIDPSDFSALIQTLQALQVGDHQTGSWNDSVTAIATSNLVSGSLTILQDSSGTETSNASESIQITQVPNWPQNLDSEDAFMAALRNLKFRVSGSSSGVYNYGWTVINNGKAGKVILTASRTGSLTTTIYSADEAAGPGGMPYPDYTETISGSLTVYGADDAEKYRFEITDETKLYTALRYFGHGT
ncbi:hypothetical protein AGMMS50293_07060 [Spirochaetia bacterium]|nr:hypothetical protein AGMMS50293_07060 [Spirochaetia bacterium]